MAKAETSSKRVAIDKASAQMVAIVAVSAFVTVFCLMASKTVLSQNQYNSRVMSAKQKAYNQLQDNTEAFSDLQKSYQAFNSTSTNVIGGLTEGSGDNDGSNSKIILNALPSTYDFPALTSSLEKILKDRGLKVSSITGTDDQVNQQSNTSSSTPEPVEIPFTFSVSGANYKAVNELFKALQSSIRPFQVDKLSVTGGGDDMTVTVDAHTYFQPARSIEPTKKVIK
ncbi:MAG: hypothetical protein U0524_03155 [Candidatus Saccharimonadales bacterium]